MLPSGGLPLLNSQWLGQYNPECLDGVGFCVSQHFDERHMRVDRAGSHAKHIRALDGANFFAGIAHWDDPTAFRCLAAKFFNFNHASFSPMASKHSGRAKRQES